MSDLTLRLQKGSRLTYEELDQNFINLNTDKYESGDSISVANINANGDIVITGSATSGSYIVAGGTSSQFLKADGSLDSTNYSDTLDSVTSRGNTTLNSIDIGAATINGQLINNVPAGSANPQFIKAQDSAGGLSFAISRARGTLDIPTTLSDTDRIGGFNWFAHDGTDYIQTASIATFIDGTTSTGVVPTKISFSTAETNTLVERMAIRPNGFVDIINPISSALNIKSETGNTFLQLSSDNINHINFRSYTTDVLLSQIRVPTTDESLRLRTGGGGTGLADRLVIYSDGDIDINQNLTVFGDLTVSGNTTSVNSVNLDVEDSIITLNKGQVTPLNDIGILFQRYATATATDYNIALAWDEATDSFIIGKTPEDGNDNDISFNSSWLTIDSNGNVGVAENLNVGGIITGVGSGLTNVNAATIDIAESIDDDVDYEIPFLTSTAGGASALAAQVDNQALQFNPGLNLLKVNNISAIGTTELNLWNAADTTVFSTTTDGITVTGSLGVNTNTPDRPLHVLNLSTTNPNTILVQSSDTNNNESLLRFDDPATTSTSTQPHIGSNGDDFVIRTGNTDRIRVAGTGGVTFTGAVSTTGLDVNGDYSIGYRPYYKQSWQIGGQTDLNWKKLADVTLPTGLYRAASFKVSYTDAFTNYGASDDPKEQVYYLSCNRSGAVQDDANNATVKGPYTDRVRVVKTATGVYEIQARSYQNYRHINLEIEVVSELGSSVTYAGSTPPNGSTTGTIYVPTGANIIGQVDQNNWVGDVTVAGTVTASGGNSTNWNTAYGWGDHASAGYLQEKTNASGSLDDKTAAIDEGWYSWGSVAPTGAPFNYGVALTIRDTNQNNQLAFGNSTPQVAIRRANSGTYSAWNYLWGSNDFSSTDISNWNTAYSYSQVGHLPLAGGTITGNSTVQAQIVFDKLGTANATTTSYDSQWLVFKSSGWDTNGGTARDTYWYLRAEGGSDIYPEHSFAFYEDSTSEKAKLRLYGRGTSGYSHPTAAVFGGDVSIEAGTGTTAGVGNLTVAGTLQTGGDITIADPSSPVLRINDTDATNNTNLAAWVSFQRNGTEAGYVGFGSSGNDYLYLTNNSGSIQLNPSTGVVVNSDLDVSGALSFGSVTRQMINLWSTSYGIGVQSNTQYYRTANSFAWFRGGVHDNTQFNAGTGGTLAMKLDASSNLTVTGNVTATSFVDDNGASLFGDGSHGWIARSHKTTATSLIGQTSDGNNRFWIYADTSGNQGFLTTAGSWSFRINESKNIDQVNDITVTGDMYTSQHKVVTSPDGPAAGFDTLTADTTVGAVNVTDGSGPFGNAWYNLVNVRHRGGTGDGTNYGGQLAWGMTNYDGQMAFRRHNATTWGAWHPVFTDTAINKITTGNLIYELDGSQGFIPYLTQARGGSSVTGAIKIKFPVHGTADMINGWVDIFDYTTSESISIYIAGYLYQTTGNNEWVNPTAIVYTKQTGKDFTVRFGADGTNSCIWIGEVADTWAYPQVTLRDWSVGYTSDVDAYATGTTVTWVTAFDTVDLTISGNLPVSQACTGNAATATWADTVDVNSGQTSQNAWYDVVWHSGDTVYSTPDVEIYPSLGALSANQLRTARYIYSRDDTDTYLDFGIGGTDAGRMVAGGEEAFRWGANYLMAIDNDTIRLGGGSDFRMWHDGTNTIFRNYNHAAGSIYFQGEDTAGVNHGLIYMYCDNAAPYVALFYDGGTRLTTTSAGISVTGTATATAFSGSGASLTSLNASNISSGTIADARLPSTISTTTLNATSVNATSSFKCGTDASSPVGFTVNDGGGNCNIVFNHFSNTVQTAGANTARITHNTDSTSSSTLSFNIGNGGAAPTNVMTITSSGITSTGNVTAYSDERLKSNIQTLDGSKVYQMRGVSFTKDDKEGSGVIAQELQKVAPELVNDEGEYLSVAYGNLTGYLIEAVKEQNELINNQQAQIDELRQMILEMKNAAS